MALLLRTPRWPRASPRIKKGTGTWSRRKEGKKGEEGGGPCAKSTGDCRQTKVDTLHARLVGRRHQGVSEGRPVLSRHLEGNEGEVCLPNGRTRGPAYPEDQEGGSPSGPQKRGRRFSLRRGARAGGQENAEISARVSTRSLEIRDLNETVEKEEVVPVLCLALGIPVLYGSCRLFTSFGGVKTAVIRLDEADAARLLQLCKVRIGCVSCRINEHAEVARCHGSRGCDNPDRKNIL